MKVGDKIIARRSGRIAKVLAIDFIANADNEHYAKIEITELPRDYVGVVKVGQVLNATYEVLVAHWLVVR